MSKILFIFLTSFVSFNALLAESSFPIIDYQSIHHPHISTTGMVVSQRKVASQV